MTNLHLSVTASAIMHVARYLEFILVADITPYAVTGWEELVHTIV